MVALTTASIWHEYIIWDLRQVDPLLVVCWTLLIGLCAWRAKPQHDLAYVIAGLMGGALIETWGTRSGLWTYFNGEKPPLFILPAWGFAALATHRVTELLSSQVARFSNKFWWPVGLVMSALFLATLLPWVQPGIDHSLTRVALVCVAITLVTTKKPSVDSVAFVVGSAVGWLLEYWGTTRRCWVYWDGGTPPLASVLSHGFATVAFARLAEWLVQFFGWFRSRFFRSNPFSRGPGGISGTTLL